MINRKLSAGVVVTGQPPGRRYLLLRAFRNWDFPKGLLAPGETHLAAARREAREEAGLTHLDFRWGEVCRETESYAGGKVARYYLAVALRPDEVHLPVNPELGRPEHHEFRWVDYAEGRELLNQRLRAILEWAQRRINEDS